MAELLGDAPVQPEYVEAMTRVSHVIDEFFNGGAKGDDKKVGFVLMVFPFEDHGGRTNYMSNAKREDVVIMLKHQIKRFEGQPDLKGTA